MKICGFVCFFFAVAYGIWILESESVLILFLLRLIMIGLAPKLQTLFDTDFFFLKSWTFFFNLFVISFDGLNISLSFLFLQWVRACMRACARVYVWICIWSKWLLNWLQKFSSLVYLHFWINLNLIESKPMDLV